jgi:hypothetical protein
MNQAVTYPPFSLSRLLRTVFDPIEGLHTAILIDLDDPSLVKDFEYLKRDGYSVQKHAYEKFYQGLREGVADELNLSGCDLFAYQTTGGSNLDLPDEAWSPDGRQVSLSRDVYPVYGLILCITDYSATAPLTAFAKQYGFRGATMHGMNDIILSSGLCVDYNEISEEAEKIRRGMTGAEYFEIDFDFLGRQATLRLITDGQEAQKSHGLCHGTDPDIANLPAGEVYYVPESAEGQFPMQYEKDPATIGLMTVVDGKISEAVLVEGNEATVASHNAKMKSDPVTGEIGELGFGTQTLPVSGSDIQDEKRRGTVHVATGRSDHLGGDLTPDKFEEAGNATHDDILFAPHKTPKINVSEVRMVKSGETQIIIQNYEPSDFINGLLAKTLV